LALAAAAGHVAELAGSRRQTPASRPLNWGAGRIAFIARFESIRSELGQGLPLTVIYDRHKAALGIGYPSFCKLVARYADDAKLARRRRPIGEAAPQLPETSPRATPPSPAGRKPTLPPPPEGPAYAAGHAAALPATRTFRHSPVPKAGEIDQLLGSGFLAKRGKEPP
jgi:hypothetical protein